MATMIAKTKELLDVAQQGGTPYITRDTWSNRSFEGYPNGVEDIRVSSFQSGESQIDISTYEMKQGWCAFKDDYYGQIELDADEQPMRRMDGVEIRENGNLLYQDGSILAYEDNDWATGYPLKHRYESYHCGEFDTKEAAMQYLQEKYPDAQWQSADKAMERKPDFSVAKYVNPEWQAEVDDTYAAWKDSAWRLAVKDLGPTTMRDGSFGHKIVYEYAGDFQSDKMMEDGAPWQNSHDVRVKKNPYSMPDVYFKSLQKKVNAKGCESTDYMGVVYGQISTQKYMGRNVPVVETVAMMPREPLDIAKQEAFVAEVTGKQKSAPAKQTQKETVEKEIGQQVDASDLTRLLVKDHGMQKNQEGKLYHKVDFAYACDQMKAGIDKLVTDPYLSTTKVKMPDGDTRTSHSMYLSDDVYDRLQSVLNKDGCDGKDWDGVFLGETKIYKGKATPDLTKAAFDAGKLQKPAAGFNATRHGLYVKTSQEEVGKQRVAALESRLPDMAASVDTERQFGE